MPVSLNHREQRNWERGEHVVKVRKCSEMGREGGEGEGEGKICLARR